MTAPTKIITLRGMPVRLWKEARMVAMRNDISLQDFVQAALREHIVKYARLGTKVQKSIYEEGEDRR